MLNYTQQIQIIDIVRDFLNYMGADPQAYRKLDVLKQMSPDYGVTRGLTKKLKKTGKAFRAGVRECILLADIPFPALSTAQEFSVALGNFLQMHDHDTGTQGFVRTFYGEPLKAAFVKFVEGHDTEFLKGYVRNLTILHLKCFDLQTVRFSEWTDILCEFRKEAALPSPPLMSLASARFLACEYRMAEMLAMVARVGWYTNDSLLLRGSVKTSARMLKAAIDSMSSLSAAEAAYIRGCLGTRPGGLSGHYTTLTSILRSKLQERLASV